MTKLFSVQNKSLLTFICHLSLNHVVSQLWLYKMKLKCQKSNFALLIIALNSVLKVWKFWTNCFQYKIKFGNIHLSIVLKPCCFPMVAAYKCKTQRICKKIKIFILSILALNSVFEVGNFWQSCFSTK
jgi:hypothetical protein